MTRDEILRVLDFVDRTSSLAAQRTSVASNDARWNIVSFCMRRHLEGKLLTTTSVTSAADVPYGTALRRVNELVGEGLLMKRPRTKTGRSHSLHPTTKLIKEFESFAIQMKMLIGSTFGFAADDDGLKDFYFGGSYMTARILSFPSAMRQGIGYDRPLKILSHSDPTFKTLVDFSRNLNEFCGGQLEISTRPLDDLRKEIVDNAARRQSAYDIVAIDIPWIGEFAERGVMLPLDEIIAKERYNHSDFHTSAWRGSTYAGAQYGIPIQPTPELLFYRSDLFAGAGIGEPETTDDVLLAAKTLHRSDFDLSGIVMNYGRGTPVGHTFMQTMAAFGQPVINLTPLGDDFDIRKIEGENFRPVLQSEVGRRTAEYLLELKDYAHPESMICDWDRRIRIFSNGHAAMTYGWSIRSAYFELDSAMPAHGQVGFVVHPGGDGAGRVSPMGGFSLAIPANLPKASVRRAWKMIEYLTRPELMKWYVQNGNLISPRFSTSADPEVQSFSTILRKVDLMEKRGQLKLWPRPPIPEFSDIVSVLGDEVHAMLNRSSTVEASLGNAQARIDRIMRDNGRY